ncbi:beta-glucosidase BglX [Edaphobacter sp. HDX4]|uniref:beta-glucosidase BglX n=1 Tax=Edaphobacter sp. HDX4 TaxID=2794064 RepID=UPI002FE58A01
MSRFSLSAGSRRLLTGALVLLSLALPRVGSSQDEVARQRPTARSEGDRFVDTLLAKMTLEEKIGQMSQIALNSPEGPKRDERILKGEVGSFLFVRDPKEIDRLQHLAVEKSRLHIPLLFGFDVVHGYRTVYPVPLALAASWDPATAERAQRMAAREASSVGIRWTFAPMVDIARDPRWGRIMEGAGEDPFLGSRMAEAQVRGFQGSTLSDPGSILACVKHFAGYGAAAGGRDYDSSDISDEQLQNVYLPPFHAAINAGAGSIMSAYMDLNGVPATGNRWLLHDVLRKDWGFQGLVVSDWDSVPSLTTHGFASGPEDAAVRAVNAGVDMEMTSTTFRTYLADAVKKKLVAQSTIDDAVRSILLAKYKLGLFKNPYVPLERSQKELVSDEQRSTARAIATRTAVLLRNQNSLLPLKKDLHSIALIGPLIDSQPDIMGSWSLGAHPQDTVTVEEGLKRYLASSGTKLLATKGVEIERQQPSIFDDQFPSPKPTLTTDEAKQAEFNHAIDLVKQADVSMLILGEAQTMSGERASRSSLTLPGRQEQLLEAAVATGKPIVLVLVNGRPLNITWASEHVPAILDVWYPGTEAGDAIAELLFGEAVPGGKLPVTWPRSVGQVPIYYGRNLTQIPNDPDTRYWDGSGAPLYPFGYGMSYTTFSLGVVETSAKSVPSGGSVDVFIDVQNTGTVTGDEVVQLYTHQRSGSASRPVRELKGFRRITLKPGERQTVTLKLDTRELGFWSSQTRRWAIEAGVFDLWVGTDSNATQHATLEVTPQR